MPTPTSEQINSLPEPLRKYIHDLETRCDPAGEVRQLGLLKDQNEQLQAKVAELLERARRVALDVCEDCGTKIPAGQVCPMLLSRGHA